MSMNHHMLAKTTTDAVLANFKSGAWGCLEENIGPSLYRVGCDSVFPSPDASFMILIQRSKLILNSSLILKLKEEFSQA